MPNIFLTGTKHNRDYALETLIAAVDAGAEFLVLCDTNGGTLPFEIVSIIDDVRRTTWRKIQHPTRRSARSSSAFIPTTTAVWPWPIPSKPYNPVR